MIRAIIVDDQLQARKYLKKQLALFPDIEVIAEGSSADQGKDLIEKLSPDLVFLDVEMPEKDSFTMLEEMDIIDFGIIFVTGYSKYAISAIKNNALDYILKPVQGDELKEAIERFKEKEASKSEINKLIPSNYPSKKILLPSTKGYKLVNLNEIVYCESSGRYTTFHFSNNSPITVAQNLGSFESGLVKNNFVRVRSDTIINLQYFDVYDRGKGLYGEVSLANGVRIKVSKTRKNGFLNALKGFRID